MNHKYIIASLSVLIIATIVGGVVYVEWPAKTSYYQQPSHGSPATPSLIPEPVSQLLSKPRVGTPTAGAQQNLPLLSITSPLDGTVVAPGETINVVVEIAPGVTFANGVGVFSFDIGASGPLFTPPFKFQLTIPTNTSIRETQIRAIGYTTPDAFRDSPPVTLIVERSDLPIQLQVKPSQVSFSFVGEQQFLDVTGIFSDGTIKTITKTSRITYSSSNPAVAVVSKTGVITTLSPGTATVTVKYGSLSVDVRLSVPPTIPGDLNGDGEVDKEDLNIILGVLNTPANTPFDPRDLNGDGKIDAFDARKLQLLCTRPRCATK